ncbi:uncharacterized protein [Clytia hemisphaerica]|uniref:uncharacterized protein n=1 Tax=Clytia hemisphaerica TaxID=252671 RepID=UPI0034D4B734
MRLMGPGCYMGKIDIKHAFRLCPVHPDDWPLLGYCWQGKYFFDLCLPFGSRSSPCIFNMFADALQWILVRKCLITAISHYLDDFILCAPSFNEAQLKMDVVQALFKDVGVPVALDKLEGPSQVMTYLGIEIDSVSSSIRLPTSKLVELKGMVSAWRSKRKCTKRELLSLIGSLSFACKVIRPGRIFLRRLIDLSSSVVRLNHHIDLTSDVRLDLEMWSEFLDSWNGSSFIPTPISLQAPFEISTDASFLGFGCFFQGLWISEAWPFDVSLLTHISFLEFFAIFASLNTWLKSFSNCRIVVSTDNEPTASVWSSSSSKDKSMMVLIRKIFFLTARNNIHLSFRHVPGSENVFADLLSRLQVEEFKSVCPGCCPFPSTVPNSVMDLLATILLGS